MKVLLINHFPLEGSGSGTYTKNIALHLRKRGHEVCVIFPENRQVLMLPGIRMFPVMFSAGKASWSSLPFNFPCFTTHPQSRTTFADLSSGELAQYLTLFSSVLRQAVREFQPDVIHAQHAWCLSWLASLCDIPLVVTIHGTDLMGCRKWPVFRGFAEEAIAGSAKVLAISQDNRDLAISVLPSCANRLLLLPNGYNEDIFYPEEVDRESLFDSLGLPYRGEYIVLFVEEQAASIFADVPADAYYAKAVEWAVKKGITNGKANGLFGSNDSCTRAQIVTFLWRAAGSPAPKGTAKVPADVLPGSYCYDAVAWALENGIINGLADGTFGVNNTCTRGQSVTFLYRAMGTAPTTVNGFTDVAADSFCADAVAWAVENGVTNGTSATTFSPNNGCTRAQIVTFLYRAYQGK